MWGGVCGTGGSQHERGPEDETEGGGGKGGEASGEQGCGTEDDGCGQ